MKRIYTLTCLLCLIAGSATAQIGKLSPWLRQISRPQTTAKPFRSPANDQRRVCAFIRTDDDGQQVLRENGCRELARFGNLYIADIPISRLRTMAADPRVGRIEARPSGQVLNDSLIVNINATKAYAGDGLPQAFTGRGVVMGIMDIGFDLTHPTFFNDDATEYRIRAFWDMLSADTIGSPFYVGRDYQGTEELLALGHSRDGLDQTHGTHTLGTAAGSGAGSKYVGMAPESDICIVANAVSDDLVYIDSADVYKYTYATDALGFKYIFDYAESQGKPCVISFSEGSGQDFWGYDVLYYEMLDSLTGPGRIIVSSAGNNGIIPTWFHKPAGQASAGVFISNNQRSMMVTLKADDDFDLRFVSYIERGDTLTVPMHDVLAQEDSTLAVQFVNIDEQVFDILIEAYPSCYNPEETCYDVTVTAAQGKVGIAPSMSLEVVGEKADVEGYRVTGIFPPNAINPSLVAEANHSVLSPATAPCVICVGATGYRRGIENYEGKWKQNDGSFTPSHRGSYSSIGPTYDGRIKPDVLAPGTNIISSYSSYYLENHPNANDINWDVEHFDFRGRTYAWNANSGTSMSSPAVGGAIALWLEACPTLSPDDIIGILSRTCRHNDPDHDYPNIYDGYGEIDVYAGLLDILGVSAIKAISREPSAARLTPLGEGRWRLSLPRPATSDLRLTVYALSGQIVARQSLASGQQEYAIDMPALKKDAVYAVQMAGDASAVGSLLIRP